jgi:hypothetical protein
VASVKANFVPISGEMKAGTTMVVASTGSSFQIGLPALRIATEFWLLKIMTGSSYPGQPSLRVMVDDRPVFRHLNR